MVVYKNKKPGWNKGKKYPFKSRPGSIGRKAWNKGMKLSEEYKRKISEALKGEKNYLFGKHLSAETKKKLSDAGKKRGAPWNIGRKRPDVSERNKNNIRYAKDFYSWRGDITPINHLIRSSKIYKLWKEEVLKRDGYQCSRGGKDHGSKLHIDHIKPLADFLELIFDLDNGRTLCEDCHRKTPTYAKRINKKNI